MVVVKAKRGDAERGRGGKEVRGGRRRVEEGSLCEGTEGGAKTRFVGTGRRKPSQRAEGERLSEKKRAGRETGRWEEGGRGKERIR